MNLSLDDISDMNIAGLGIDSDTIQGQKELLQYTFVKDAIESMNYSSGRPSKWSLFYDKWLAFNFNKEPSYLIIITLTISMPFLWLHHKIKYL